MISGRLSYMSMGDRIRERRKELKLTQEALAKIAGVNRVTVTGWEKDDYQPNGANLQALAEALKCNPIWLVEGTGSCDAPYTRGLSVSVRELPVLSWVQAGTWTETDSGVCLDDVNEYITTTLSLSSGAFALRVNGSSMTTIVKDASIPDGSIVIVEPDLTRFSSINGKIVVAYIHGGTEATLKKFVEDWPNRYLIPLNPFYKTIDFDENCRIVGVVKQVLIDF
ncbi:TPA: helix-turn-helix domain-containing protein [Providencia rettgeri]|nr:helix-turn-helix domain-containing protein [Providencia rettgeri]